MSQTSMNYNAIDNSSNLIEILSIPSKFRTEKGVSKAVRYIRNLQPFAYLFHSNNSKTEKQLITELTPILYHRKFTKNTIVKRVGEIDSKVFIILKGKVAELGIKYEKIKLTQDEYLIQLIKLDLVNETELLAECIKQNKSKYPVSINNSTHSVISWIKQNYPEDAIRDMNNATAEISQIKRLYQDQSMGYYLAITNPFDIDEHNNIRLGSKMKYPLLIPSYCHLKTLCIGDYIGTFSLNKKYKIYSSFVAIENTSIGVIEKHLSNNFYNYANFYALISNVIKEDLCELMRYFFIFQALGVEYFENVLSPLMTYRTVAKGELIMRQNSCFEGIYFVKSGEFKISTERTLDDLMLLIITLKQSLDNFKGVVSYLKNNILDDYSLQYSNSNININNKAFNDDNKKTIHEIIISKTNSRHILGLNEYFSSKTDIVNFNVECVSERAEVFFLPKESYFSIIEKNEEVKSRITKLIEQNVYYFIQTIRRFRDKAILQLEKAIKAKNRIVKDNNAFCHFPKVNSSTNSDRLIHYKQLTKQKLHSSVMRGDSSIGSALKRRASQGLSLFPSNAQIDNKNQFNKTVNEKRLIQTPLPYKAKLVELSLGRNKIKKVHLGGFRIRDWSSISNLVKVLP